MCGRFGRGGGGLGVSGQGGMGVWGEGRLGRAGGRLWVKVLTCVCVFRIHFYQRHLSHLHCTYVIFCCNIGCRAISLIIRAESIGTYCFTGT